MFETQHQHVTGTKTKAEVEIQMHQKQENSSGVEPKHHTTKRRLGKTTIRSLTQTSAGIELLNLKKFNKHSAMRKSHELWGNIHI